MPNSPSSPPSAMRRRTLRVDQAKLDQVMEWIGTRSPSVAVNHALAYVIEVASRFRDEAIGGIRAIAGKGGVENYFDDEDRWPVGQEPSDSPGPSA
ncbi:MAG TPA: hypothetical protein VFQ45_08335 [Longimicrobium sp.]|nr:hypothetical protein [Longimicrobium sp.]